MNPNRKVVYISHPLNAPAFDAIERNRENASRWCAWAALQGFSPVADWIVLSGVLSEEHRELGLACDLALIERCDELWLVGGRVSAGMAIERDHAERRGMRVRDLTSHGYTPPRLRPMDPVDLAMVLGAFP